MPVRDYTPWLEEAIAGARAAGLVAEADELESRCFKTAYTTSGELMGEHGLAIRRFLKATRGRAPKPVRAKLNACLVELGMAWPGWRRLWEMVSRGH
jgi:hypothetical protein